MELIMTISTDPWESWRRPDTLHPNPTIKQQAQHKDLSLAELAKTYVRLKAAHEETKAKLDQVAHAIIHFFRRSRRYLPPVPAYEIIAHKEQWSWDQEILDRAFSAKDSPDYIKRKLSIDKRKFQTLPASEQQRLKHALTRKSTNPKVTMPNV